MGRVNKPKRPDRRSVVGDGALTKAASGWTENDIPALDGKVALVTGANAGLGLEATKVLVRHGARVLMACRNAEKAERAADEMRSAGVAPGQVQIVSLDLASLASVAGAAKLIVDGEEHLDLLLNNAGLMAIDESKTEDGFETQFGVNHLGHFALTAGLAPLLLATPGSRIVNVSSMAYCLGRLHLDDLFFERRGYDRVRPYVESKLANLLFTTELHRRLTDAKAPTMALAAHPGISKTELGDDGTGMANKLFKLVMQPMQPAVAGALPLVRAATDPTAVGGQFYGPRWIIRGGAVVGTPSRRARCGDDARRLWERSEELTGLSIDIVTA
jgi:NAD(P)-dependent dehydrogenase (short-subunit alcohol dehydrogenase family)